MVEYVVVWLNLWLYSWISGRMIEYIVVWLNVWWNGWVYSLYDWVHCCMVECMVIWLNLWCICYFFLSNVWLLVSLREGRPLSFHSSAHSRSSADDVDSVIPPPEQFRDVDENEPANANVWSWLNDISPSTASPPGMAIPLLIMLFCIFVSYLSFFPFLFPFFFSCLFFP